MLMLKLLGVAMVVVLAVASKRLQLRPLVLLLLLLSLLLLLQHMHCRRDVPVKRQDGTPVKPYIIDCPDNKNCTPPSAPLDAGSP